MVKGKGVENLTGGRGKKKKVQTAEPEVSAVSPEEISKLAQAYNATFELLNSKKGLIINSAANAALVYLLDKTLTGPLSESIKGQVLDLDTDTARRLAKVMLSPLGVVLMKVKDKIFDQPNFNFLETVNKTLMAVIIAQGTDALKNNNTLDTMGYFVMFTAGRTLVDLYYNPAAKENFPKALLQSLSTSAASCASALYLPSIQNYVMPILSSTALSTRSMGGSLFEGMKNVINMPSLTDIGSYVMSASVGRSV